MASAVAVVDSLLLSDNLAERVRFLLLARATLSYHGAHNGNLALGQLAEQRRRLLLKGLKATLKQGERAVEVGGFVGSELSTVTTRLRDLQHAVLDLHRADLGTNMALPVNFSTFELWAGVFDIPENLGLVEFQQLEVAPKRLGPRLPISK